MRWLLQVIGAVSIALHANGLSCADSKDPAKELITKLIAKADYDQADGLATRNLEQANKQYGRQSEQTAFWSNQLGLIAFARGHYKIADEFFTASLNTRKSRLGANHPDIAISANNVALSSVKLGYFERAERLYRESHRINLVARGPSHSHTITNISNLGLLYMDQGRMDDAETMLLKALRDTQSAEGAWADNTAISLANLATLYISKLDFANAEPLLLLALQIDRQRHGDQHPLTAITLNNLGELYELKGDVTRAEQHYLQAIAIDKKFLGQESAAYAIDLINIASLYQQSARLNEARRYLMEAFDVLTQSPPSQSHAEAVAELGRVLLSQGRTAEAELLFGHAISYLERIYGAGHHTLAPILSDLARLRIVEGKWKTGIDQMRRSFAIIEKTYGTSSPQTLRSNLELASALSEAQQPTAAGDILKRTAAEILGFFGSSSIDAGRLHQLQATLSLVAGDLRTALGQQRVALRILEARLPPNSPALSSAHALLARILEQQGRINEAFAHTEVAARIEQTRSSQARMRKFSGAVHAQVATRRILSQSLGIALRYASRLEVPSKPLSAALQYADEIIAGSARNALALSLLKAEAPSGLTRTIIESQSSLLRQAEHLDRQYVSLFDSRTVEQRRMNLRNQLQEISTEIKAIDATLRRNLPAYAKFVVPHSLNLEQVQQILKDRELLLVILPDQTATYVIAVTRFSAKWHVAPLAQAELESSISALRRQLDPSQWTASFPPFNRKLAHELHKTLLKPFSNQLRDTDRILLVTDTLVSSLPLGVLISKLDSDSLAANSSPDELRRTRWLAKTHSITTLPSIALLQSIRTQQPWNSKHIDFIGIGAPSLTKSSPFPPLHHAERELLQLASLHKTAELLTGSNATKPKLLKSNISSADVISFATHTVPEGAMDNGEPGLLLSPSSSQTDSHVLSVSDIVKLRLNADWVILSACNTAGAGGTQTRNIANAFLQAGARSLLISHWPVSDSKAAQLTTRTLSNYRKRPGLSQSEALRLAMMDLMGDPSHPLNAHPSSWAAFSLLGEARFVER